MSADLHTPLDQVSDLRHRVRRLHWFQQSFKNDAIAFGQRYGRRCRVNDRALAQAFLNWADAFARERVNSRLDRRDFVVFSGGLMLRELLRAAPATSEGGEAARADQAEPLAAICDFWPEGFLYASYCIAVVRAILESDFDGSVTLSARFEDLRAWESFRENAGKDPSLAVPFFDLFVGRIPNWASPDDLLSRPAVREADALAPAEG